MTDWYQLEDCPGYAISNFGEVVSLRTDKTRRQSVNQHGVVYVTLYDEIGKAATRSVAVMVATGFVEREEEHYDTPIHLDGDRMNCSASNLRWRPRWFAIKYHKQFTEQMFLNSQMSYRILGTDTVFENIRDAATTLGVYYHDVLLSADNGTPVYPGGWRFSHASL